MATAFKDAEVPGGTVNGTNPTFTLAIAPNPAFSLILVKNGATQKQGLDYSLSSGTITFESYSLPQTGDKLLAWYRYDDGSVVEGGGSSANPEMMSVQDALKAALRKSGIIKHGQTPNSDENADGLGELNRMLDAWRADGLNATTRQELGLTLVAQKQTYTIGVDPSGVLTAEVAGAKPVRIETATIQVASEWRFLNVLLHHEQWVERATTELYTVPRDLYNNRNHPLSTLSFWPAPDAAYPVRLYTPQRVATYLTVADNIIAAEGWRDAIVYNLAVRLACEFDKPLRGDVAEMARTSLATIQRANLEIPIMECDGAILSGRGGFDILTGRYR